MGLHQMLKIVIAGASGFLGTPLARALASAGHQVVGLSRSANRSSETFRTVAWEPNGGLGQWASEIDGADAVVNLAGESIAAGRWTEARKARITSSRVLATRSLVEAIRGARQPPAVFVSGSAVGYYGACGDELVTEQTAAGRDFLAEVCVAWEREANRAVASNTRVVTIRTGLVLARDGGALPRMLPPFWIGAGGPVGSGTQYWPWIHRDDWVALVRFAIESTASSGPVNATAPHPVTNREFANALGRAMHRPAIMPTPAFALRLLLGEMADGLLLSGQRAVPAQAERLGFKFTYKNLPVALAQLFARR